MAINWDMETKVGRNVYKDVKSHIENFNNMESVTEVILNILQCSAKEIYLERI